MVKKQYLLDSISEMLRCVPTDLITKELGRRGAAYIIIDEIDGSTTKYLCNTHAVFNHARSEIRRYYDETS